MHKIYGITFIFFFLTSIQSVTSQKLDHVLGEVIVEVRNDRAMGILYSELNSNHRYKPTLEVKKLMSEPMNLWVLKTDPNEVNENKFLNDIILHKEVLLAQKNHISQLRLTPNDTNFSDQWQYINTGQSGGVVGADMDMDLAWDIATGGLTSEGDTIVVCVIDDGINPTHPDLDDNLWVNHLEVPDNGIDDDLNGYIDDVRGWNAYNNDDNVYVGGGHGTPVAGIVGAQGNNEVGVAGVNWDVKLMIVRGGSPESTALASYAYPYTMRKLYNDTNGEKGAFVVSTNASWGVDFGDPEDAPIWCDFYNTLGEVGILNFGATINGNTNVDEEGDLPTACESNYLVSVTNMNRNDIKVNGAGYGFRTIDLGAYGAQTYTLTSGGYGGFGGTSGATPHVAGTAALLYSADCPDFIALSKSNPAQAALVVKDCILHGVVPNASLLDRTTTGGKLNAFNAISNLMSTCGECTEAFGGEVRELTDQMGTLTWFDNQNVGTTSIRFKNIDDTDWIEIENVESGYQFENLIACTAYEYQTKTVCASNPDAEYTYSRIFETEGCCDIPNGITIEVVDQSATIQWDDVMAASNFIVEYRNINDADWTIIDNGETNQFTIEEILDCQFYEVRIKSKCDATNNESEFSEIFKVNGDCDGCTMEFCSFTDKNISDEWIQSVEIEDVFVNESGVDPNGYGNYLGQFDITLNANQEYGITLVPGYTGTKYTEFFSAYIDYNSDAEFEENEAIFFSQEGTTDTVRGTFIVPFNAVDGVSRMRIVMRFDESNGPCDEFDFEYGEIEEYCVTIVGNSACPETFSAIVRDTMETTIDFEVAENNQVDSYLILYREKGTEEFITVSSQLNTIQIANLNMCSVYEYKSGYICQGNVLIDSLIYEANTLCVFSATDLNATIGLNVYPNPSSGAINIDFDTPVQEEGIVELFSIDGRQQLLSNPITKGSRRVNFNAAETPNGLYFIKVTVGNKVSTQKWIKY